MASLVVGLCVAFLISVHAEDPCNQYQTLNQHQRSPQYKPGNNDNVLCDVVLTVGWYRFHNAEMPFGSCIQRYHCGTHVPLWLQGTAPTPGDGIVTRTVCGQLREGGDCCEYKKAARVRNCGTHMVYFLSPVPGCSMAYCAGSPPPCGVGETSPTGFQPGCHALYPKLTKPPVLSPPVVEEPDFKFICEIPYPVPSKEAVEFHVTWLADGKPIHGAPVQTITGTGRSAELYGGYLAGQTNKDVACSVTSRFVNSNSTSPAITSNQYWVGIKSNISRVVIDSGHTKETIKLTSTVPVVCDVIGDKSCTVDFQITTDNSHVYTDSCRVQLKPGSWNQGTHSASTTFTVLTEPMFAKKPQTVTLITAVPKPDHTGSLWNNMTLPQIHVEKKPDKIGAECTSYGDPHIKTFDNKKRYDLMHLGQYTMVQQRSGGSFRVEARTWKCGRAICNCGVAMREGNDVIVIDMCNGRYGQTVARMSIRNPAMFTHQTRIKKDPSGNKHIVTFPSGAMVTVISTKIHVDFRVGLPASFIRDVEGACGFFDHRAANDLTASDGSVSLLVRRPEAFVQSWRIPQGASLFDTAQPLPQPLIVPKFCRCQTTHGVNDCSGTDIHMNTTVNILCPDCIDVNPPTLKPMPSTSSPGTISGATRPPMMSTTPPLMSTTPYMYPHTTPVPPAAVSTTQTPMLYMNHTESTKTCEGAMKRDPSLVQCIQTSMALEYQDILNMCVMDMKLTGDIQMALSAISSLMAGCGYSNVLHPPATNLPLAVVCPRACSLHGDCVNGHCRCDAGYESSDCSVKSGVDPTIDAIDGGEYCDMEKEECFEPTIVGENVKGKNIKCRCQEIAEYGGQEYILQDDITMATFQSTLSASCIINPPPKGSNSAFHRYKIGLSNNGGTTIGNQLMYTVYSSKCMICEAGKQCKIKPDTCLINDHCYTKGEEDTVDHTGYCDPDRSLTSWSPAQATPTPTPTAVPTATKTAATTDSSNMYTGSTSGCGCYFAPARTDCACCVNSGCPCDEPNQHRCYDCITESMCKGS